MAEIEIQREAEQVAARYLAQKGYDVIARSWRCPSGRVDIIARDGGELVFAEVAGRCRAQAAPEAPRGDDRSAFEAKAEAFADRYGARDVTFRFDRVSILIDRESDRAVIRHYINAFG